MIANTPDPPYYAVIFTSLKNVDDIDGYAQMAEIMEALAAKQPGYLGCESAREIVGITVSYWKNIESIKLWKANTEHQIAQQFGKEKWYSAFTTRICLVEKAYAFSK